MIAKVLDILFGKQAQIFDNKGNVQHKLPKHRWDNWKKRYSEGEEFNWKNHSGMKAGGSAQK